MPVAIRVIGQGGRSDGTNVLVPVMLAGEERELVLEIADGLDGLVVGQVVCAETREPVAGARVRVLTGGQTRTEWHTPGPDERTTGNDGRFELPFALRSDPLLCVEADGYGLRYASLDAVHTDVAHTLVVYVSHAASLSARVLDASGAPIPDAWVELAAKGNWLAYHDADQQSFFSSGISFSFPPDEHWRGQTGADGRVKVEGLAPRVEISLEVVKQGKHLVREPEGLTLQPGEQKELEWRIGSGTTLRGLALDQDGKPVSGLSIWAEKAFSTGSRYFAHYERDSLGAQTHTDDEGRFTLADLAAGRWSIGPGVEDGSSVAPIAEGLELSGEPTRELTLHVFRGLFIRGRVLTPAGEPAQGGWVNGFRSESDRLEGAQSGSEGSFALGPLGPGTITLMADAIGRFASSGPVQASAGDSGIVLQLKLGGTIRGRVVDTVTGAACPAQLVFMPEQPIPGVLASGMQTTTQPDGSFASSGLEPGRWSVTASTADGKFAQHAHVDVGAGTDSGELVFALSPGGRLRLGYKGARPLVFVTVTCKGAPALMQTGVKPGKFAEYMAPAGSLALEIRKDSTGPARERAVELKPGETKEIVITDED
jgi:protocatechuate 3,4-dioxygenase beta subunit